MALADASLPYGLRDVKITPIKADGTYGTPIDLPNSQTFSFSENEDFEELRGDDKVVTVVGKGPSVDWELESGGLPLAAVVAMFGGVSTDSGTTGSATRTVVKKTSDRRPFFKVEGQSISDNGGDVHCVLPRCRATGDLKGEFADGKFWTTGAKGQALGATSGADMDVIYKFVQNETATAISNT